MTLLSSYSEFSNESVIDKIKMICQKENWSLAQFVNKLNEEEKTLILDSLGDDQGSLLYDWSFWGRPNQIPPDIDWYIFAMIAGRGAGKTRSGAEWVNEVANEESGRRIALVSRTAADVRDVMIMGDSGIMNVGNPENRPEYFTSKRLLVWPNGTQAQAFSSEEPDQLRGPQFRLDVDTPMLTVSGWKTMGTLEKGDLIFDEKGEICRVTDVHPEANCRAGKVIFSNGYSLVADAGHLWKTIDVGSTNIPRDWAHTVEPKPTKNLVVGVDAIPSPTGELIVVVGLEGVATTRMRCITVDSPSHLYLAGEGLIPTHNTHAWADEPAAWKHTEDDSGLNAWDNLTIATRLGDNPQIFATTTPKRTPFMYDLLDQEKNYKEGKSDEIIVITRGTTMDNIGNLSKKYVNRMLSLYEGTHLAEQELYGQMLEEVDGALWNDGMISDHRVNALPAGQYLKVISVDPSVAEDPNDECGIVVVAASKHKRLSERHAYVLADESIQGSPAVWAQKVVDVWLREQCPVVAEVNQGGALVAAAIHAIDDRVPILTVHAKQGKKLRAEPVALKYEKGQVHHVGVLALTESQMTSWVPGETKKSPDRVDALVHGVTALLIKPPSRLGSGKIRAKRPSQTKLNFKTGKMVGR